jgi:hypothetical protein
VWSVFTLDLQHGAVPNVGATERRDRQGDGADDEGGGRIDRLHHLFASAVSHSEPNEDARRLLDEMLRLSMRTVR